VPDNTTNTNGVPEIPHDRTLMFIEPRLLLDSPVHVRKSQRDEAMFEDLKAAIKAMGVEVPPLAMRLPDGRYVLEDGHGRKDAVLAILKKVRPGSRPDLEKIPVLVREVSEDPFAENATDKEAIAEDLIRQLLVNSTQDQLTCRDYLFGCVKLQQLAGAKSVDAYIKKIPLSDSSRSNLRSLIKQPDLVRKVENGNLTYREARDLALKKKPQPRPKPEPQPEPQPGNVTGSGTDGIATPASTKNGETEESLTVKDEPPVDKVDEEVVLFELQDKKQGLRLVIYGTRNTPPVNMQPLARDAAARLNEMS
jgi:ParB-like chromosome segregation protein Spo0J